MATYTENYNLIKPDLNDNVDVQDLNYNSEEIDGALKTISDALYEVAGKKLYQHNISRGAYSSSGYQGWGFSVITSSDTPWDTEDLFNYLSKFSEENPKIVSGVSVNTAMNGNDTIAKQHVAIATGAYAEDGSNGLKSFVVKGVVVIGNEVFPSTQWQYSVGWDTVSLDFQDTVIQI